MFLLLLMANTCCCLGNVVATVAVATDIPGHQTGERKKELRRGHYEKYAGEASLGNITQKWQFVSPVGRACLCSAFNQKRAHPRPKHSDLCSHATTSRYVDQWSSFVISIYYSGDHKGLICKKVLSLFLQHAWTAWHSIMKGEGRARTCQPASGYAVEIRTAWRQR